MFELLGFIVAGLVIFAGVMVIVVAGLVLIAWKEHKDRERRAEELGFEDRRRLTYRGLRSETKELLKWLLGEGR